MGLDSKTPLRNLVTVGWEPNDIPFMGLTAHDKDDLAVFIPLQYGAQFSATKNVNLYFLPWNSRKDLKFQRQLDSAFSLHM